MTDRTGTMSKVIKGLTQAAEMAGAVLDFAATTHDDSSEAEELIFWMEGPKE